MGTYSAGQWVLLFYFYCFCGWVWESCYVSVKQRRWINRGFLHGPLLPIYGFGAVLILFVTLPVKNDLRLVWLLGMLAATALEYAVGAVMERLFRVRYWDYSGQRFHFRGYICLKSSVAWGFFSVLLVRFLHPPVGWLLAGFPTVWTELISLALTAIFSADTVRSVQAALDLRGLLLHLAEENEDVRRIARRVEIVSAFAEEDLQSFRAQAALDRWLLEAQLKDELAKHREKQQERRRHRLAQIESALYRRMENKLQISALSPTRWKAPGIGWRTSRVWMRRRSPHGARKLPSFSGSSTSGRLCCASVPRGATRRHCAF